MWPHKKLFCYSKTKVKCVTKVMISNFKINGDIGRVDGITKKKNKIMNIKL